MVLVLAAKSIDCMRDVLKSDVSIFKAPNVI